MRLTPLRHLSRRALSTTTRRTSAWSPGPSPPRLPKEEQELFERLQRQSTGAFSTPRPLEPTSTPSIRPHINQSPQSSSSTSTTRTRPQVNQSPQSTSPPQSSQPSQSSPQSADQILAARVDASGKGEELHPNVRRGAPPEFEGDVNPKTGEVGGPKNEPLRWGHAGDWSYNGRVTDF